MSSIRPNSGTISPIVVSPPNGAIDGVLPKGKLNDPMPTIKGDGPSSGAPGGLDGRGVPGAPGGAAKPPAFVPDAGTHCDLNDLFDGPPPTGGGDPPIGIHPLHPPIFVLTPDMHFETSKKSLVDDLNKQRAEVKSAIAELNGIIKKSRNPAQVKEAKVKLELYNAKDKCLAGFQQLVNKFKFPSGDGFSNNGQLAYAAGVFDKMHDYVTKNIVNGPKKLDVVAINKELKAFAKALADLPPVDPRIAPPPLEHTMAMNEGGWVPKPDFPPFERTQAIPEGGQMPKPDGPPLGAGGPNPRK